MVTVRFAPRITSAEFLQLRCGVLGGTMGRNTDQRNPLLLDIGRMPEPHANGTAERPLHICPGCESQLVQPIAWEQVGDRGRWRVSRCCPECGWSGEAVHGQRAIDAFDEQLELGFHDLCGQLQALERANMSAMAESFIQAIAADLITADDFRV